MPRLTAGFLVYWTMGFLLVGFPGCFQLDVFCSYNKDAEFYMIFLFFQ